MKDKKNVYSDTDFREFDEKVKGILIPKDISKIILTTLGEKASKDLIYALIKYILLDEDSTFENDTMTCLWEILKPSDSKKLNKFLTKKC